MQKMFVMTENFLQKKDNRNLRILNEFICVAESVTQIRNLLVLLKEEEDFKIKFFERK